MGLFCIAFAEHSYIFPSALSHISALEHRGTAAWGPSDIVVLERFCIPALAPVDIAVLVHFCTFLEEPLHISVLERCGIVVGARFYIAFWVLCDIAVLERLHIALLVHLYIAVSEHWYISALEHRDIADEVCCHIFFYARSGIVGEEWIDIFAWEQIHIFVLVPVDIVVLVLAVLLEYIFAWERPCRTVSVHFCNFVSGLYGMISVVPSYIVVERLVSCYIPHHGVGHLTS